MNDVIIQKIENLQKQMQSLSLSAKETLTLDEATIYLQVSKSFLYKLTSNGEITHFKPSGKLIYFRKSDLDNWVFQNELKSGSNLENEIDNYLKGNSNGKS